VDSPWESSLENQARASPEPVDEASVQESRTDRP
jgi:hypothetical protein